LTVGTPYYYVVTALTPSGESFVSNEQTITPVAGNQTVHHLAMSAEPDNGSFLILAHEPAIAFAVETVHLAVRGNVAGGNLDPEGLGSTMSGFGPSRRSTGRNASAGIEG